MEAGTAIRDITPQDPTFLVGFPHIERISQGVHDPLLASALYLRSGTVEVMLIALDILFIDPPTAGELRRRVSEKTGMPQECVFISCSHTHSGPHTAYVLEWGPSPVVPDIDPDYMESMSNSIVAAAAEAAHNLQNADVAWCAANVRGVGGNRHDPENGRRDPEVGILAVRDSATRRVFALSVTYSMHPTVLHEDSRLVSSDFPHFTREFLKTRIAPDLTVLYHTGPEGNQSPRYDVRSNTFDEAQRIGELLGEAIHERVRGLRDEDFVSEAVIAARMTQVVLPRRVLPSVEDARQTLARFRSTYQELKRSGAEHGPVRTAECDVFGAEETVYLAECRENGHLDEVLAEYTPVDVQVIRVADTYLVGFPGELFVEYGLAVKDRAGKKCFPVSLVNGELQGYVVTQEAVDKGYYESNNRVFEPEAGNVLVRAGIGLLQAM